MRKKLKLLLPVTLILAIVAGLAWYGFAHHAQIMSPKGEVASKERSLIFIGLWLSVIVVIPVYILAITVALKYREDNRKTRKYSPNWDRSKLFETIWWGVPLLIISILSVITWNSSHSLDPYRALASSNKPLTIQVVAMDWKWLFIYPDQHIASINEFAMPVNTPVNFVITSDTVMNSFWVPQLGSQIYAMPGMTTLVHLEADQAGDFPGSSANISGQGFARMNFVAKAESANDFTSWITKVRTSPNALTQPVYDLLAMPGTEKSAIYYSSVDDSLFDNIVVSYMAPKMEMR